MASHGVLPWCSDLKHGVIAKAAAKPAENAVNLSRFNHRCGVIYGNAARPPAEAPMPTMGKALSWPLSDSPIGLSAGAEDWEWVFLVPFLPVMPAPST
jgi:hypothetical protein